MGERGKEDGDQKIVSEDDRIGSVFGRLDPEILDIGRPRRRDGKSHLVVSPHRVSTLVCPVLMESFMYVKIQVKTGKKKTIYLSISFFVTVRDQTG